MLFTVLLFAITVLKNDFFFLHCFLGYQREVVCIFLCVLLNTEVSYVPFKILVCFP